MAVTEKRTQALTAAAAAAAAGAAAYGLRKANDRADGASLLETVWRAASGHLVPVADDAADAAGKWVARNSPEIMRERLIPRFIEAFQDAV